MKKLKNRTMNTLVALVLFSLIVCSCKSSDAAAVSSAAEPKEATMTSEKLEQLIETWNSDVSGDGMSLYFENGEILSREDERDLPDFTMDFEKGQLKSVESPNWNMRYYVTEDGEMTVTDDGYFEYVEPSRRYEIAPIDSLAAISEMDALPGFTQLDPDSVDAQDFSNAYNIDRIYRGFSDYDGQEMACYVILLHDEFDHAYKLTAAGTGNLSELKARAVQICSTFTIVFDLDEWLKNH